ncbi:MAG: hypothetical protein JWN34_742 [Bryobacterales bacterium]|nr:hypothetical protein [Bryobacterales bacterium]
MLALALLAIAPIRIHVDAEVFPNAAHHLACLSERISCTKASFEGFWHKELHWSPADQTALDQWKSTITAIAARQPNAQESPFMPNFMSWYPELVAVNKVVGAALGSKSAAEFRKNAKGLALAEDVETLAGSLEHFRVLLEPWWKATGGRYAETRRRQVEALLKKVDADGQASRVAAFYEAELPTKDFYLHLTPRADVQSKDATAAFVRNQMVVELTDDMQAEGLVSIVLHEMTHALYELAPAAKQRAFIEEFVRAPDPQSQPLYTILNEGLATAIQINELKRHGQSDDDPYHHPFIPRVGQAAAPVVEAAMNQGKTVFQGFASRYLKAAGEALGAELESPRFVMTTAIVADFGLSASAKIFRAEFPMLSSADFSDRTRYRELNMAFLVTYDKLNAVGENWPEVAGMAKEHRGFAFTAPRNAKGRIYVVAGRDEATVSELIVKLAALRTGSPDGLIFAVD